jgi:hypothetical protein
VTEVLLEGQACTLDGSELVSLSGSLGKHDVDLRVGYCPRCDVAFLFLSRTRTDAAPVVLEWHRGGSELELRTPDGPLWRELPRQFRECWEANVRHHVKGFLAGRFSESGSARCPMDGGKISVLRRFAGAGTLWHFSWCACCALGFLRARDDDYGWEDRADVTWDAGSRTYRLRRQYATGGDHPLTPQVVSDLPPPPMLPLPKRRW